MKDKGWMVVPATTEHIPTLAANMREADKREVWASHRHSPQEALEVSLAYSDMAWTFLGLDEDGQGEPLFMWGVARQGSILSDTGFPWLLGTNDIRKYQRTFLRYCPYYIEAMQEPFTLLENYVHAANRVSVRWLEWCGFTVEKEVPELINDEGFYRFWREK